MRRLMGWWLVLVGIGCGGGGGPLGDSGTPDPGLADDADVGECRVKEDCQPLPCRLAVCLAGACEYQPVPEGAACSDPERCIFSGVCDAQGVCAGEWACDDANPCTTDGCEGRQCTHAVVETGPCDDGNPCTQGDVCVEGACVPGGKNVCECKVDTECPPPEDLCLGRLMCDPQAMNCVPDPEARVTCEEPDNPCRENRCLPATGQCVEVVLEDGTPCDLGKCVEDGQCREGACVGTPRCVSTDPCLVATCNEETGLCGTKNAPDDTPCDDGNACTPNDRCKGGTCIADPPPAEACNGVDDDCDGSTDPENAAGCQEHYWDGDHDGWGNPDKHKCLCGPGPAGSYSTKDGGDCHDGNAGVHPGATEVCNGTDDDCDGATDSEGAKGCVPHYKDSDGDGVGVTADWKCLCGPAGSYKTTEKGDCDDTDATVHPGAAETCNKVDDDCNGSTDGGEGNDGCATWYLDHDEDGFGVDDSKCLCHATDEYTSNNKLDCDDDRPAVHPGATEVCNHLDDDCDADTDEGEGLAGCQSHYTDPDGDGYGTGGSKCLCKPQAPYVTANGGDCQEGDPAIHPGGQVCGKDGDCDAKLLDAGEPCDDGNTTTWDGCDAQCQIGEFQVNTYYVNNQMNPDVAFPGTVGNSGYFVVWQGVGCMQWFGIPPQCLDTEDGVWMRRFDGNGQGTALQLANTYVTGSQANPAVAASSANGAVVVWEGQGSDSDLTEVYARRFNADGTPKDNSATLVNEVKEGTQGNPDVAVDHYLAFRVVWQTRSSSGVENIALRAFASNLTGWPQATVNLLNRTYQRNPRVAAFDAGTRFVVVWDGASTSGGEDVWARRFLWNTTALDSEEFRVNPSTPGSQRDPSVAGNLSSGGGFVIVWTGTGPGGSGDDIWARAYDTNGVSPYAAVLVNEATAGTQEHPDVAMALDGSFVVVWEAQGDVYLRRFRSDQTPAGPGIKAHRFPTNLQINPAITGASDGTVLAAWQSDAQDGSEWGIFAQRFGPNGERLFR